LLAKHGARLGFDDKDSPFLGAIAWSRFVGAEEFLKLGADVNFQDAKKMTALHYLLKKGSDIKHIRMLIKYGARTDIQNAAGDTAGAIMRRKRDPAFRALA
jgi:ankyrin repeat protein